MTADGTASPRPTRMGFFDVPPEADDAFLAAWERDGEGVLHRALRDGVQPRYVALGAGDRYEIVAEDDRFGVEGGVLLIDRVEDEAAWVASRPAGQRGYIGRRLLRGEGGLLGITRWSSPLMIARAGLGGAIYSSC